MVIPDFQTGVNLGNMFIKCRPITMMNVSFKVIPGCLCHGIKNISDHMNGVRSIGRSRSKFYILFPVALPLFSLYKKYHYLVFI